MRAERLIYGALDEVSIWLRDQDLTAAERDSLLGRLDRLKAEVRGVTRPNWQEPA